MPGATTLLRVNRVRFVWTDDELEGETALRVEVDGQRLAELATAVEAPFRAAEGSPPRGASYAGLPKWRFDDLLEHFLGGTKSHWYCGPDEKTVLLGCTCGEPGCWPLMARVDAAAGTVTWSDFEQPHRRGRWSFDGLGPFRFDRGAYEAALRGAAQRRA